MCWRHRHRSSAGPLVDRDVPSAPRADLGALPVAPAVAEPEAGEAGHEVELGGPGVADLDRVEADLAVADHHVLAPEALAHGIVLGNLEADPLVGHRRDLEPAGEAAALGH